jgi:flagellar protein FlhE
MALASCAALAAAGSWSATVEGPRVAGAGRNYISAPLTGPAVASGSAIRNVRWRFVLPPGHTLAAELCTDRRCVPVKGARGVSDALAGEPADALAGESRETGSGLGIEAAHRVEQAQRAGLDQVIQFDARRQLHLQRQRLAAHGGQMLLQQLVLVDFSLCGIHLRSGSATTGVCGHHGQHVHYGRMREAGCPDKAPIPWAFWMIGAACRAAHR